jgi:hypothetical protein
VVTSGGAAWSAVTDPDNRREEIRNYIENKVLCKTRNNGINAYLSIV